MQDLMTKSTLNVDNSLYGNYCLMPLTKQHFANDIHFYMTNQEGFKLANYCYALLL